MATVTEPKNGNGVTAPQANTSVIVRMAQRFGMTDGIFIDVMKATAFTSKGSREEFLAFLSVAEHYNLNPLTKEIYAFPKKGGGVQAIVGIDGWANLINSNPAFDGMEFVDHIDDGGALTAITCRIFRKDRAHAVECTEYMKECKGTSEPWSRWPRRMLRHKAMIQAGRYAFGLAGIMDPDEAERAESAGWGQPQGKVGISNVNKLLDAMPAHKPTDDNDGVLEAVYDAPGDEGSQEPAEAIPGLDAALDACRVKGDVQAVLKQFAAAGLDEATLDTLTFRCQAHAGGLPEVLPAGKAKQTQRTLTE